MSEFKDKAVFISGASKGIGFALAKELSNQGARLLLHASSDEGIQHLKANFSSESNVFWKFDFTKPNEVERSISALLSEIGPLDGFVNCVGMRIRRPVNLLNVSVMQEAFNANFISYLELVRILTKRNRFNVGFSIISISSISAHAGAPGVSIYAATKGAVESATRCLAQELHRKSVRINSIVSGQVNTEAYAELMNAKENKEDEVLKRQYMGLLEPSNLVDICLFLLSSKSSFINGVSFPADGGFLS